MKKKFGLLIAILLCVVLVLTFVSCGNKDNNGTTTTSGLSDVDESVIAEKTALIDADIQKWLKENASDTIVDLSTKLTEKLKDNSSYILMTKKMDPIYPNPVVTFNKNSKTYTIVVTWTNKSGESVSKTFTATAVPATYNGWAGSFKDGVYDDIELDDITDTDDKLDVLDDILDSAFAMVNKTVTDSVSGKFGVQGTLGVEFGESNYGIDVKGNIDLTASEQNGTEFAVVAKNGDTTKTFGGLYYANGATDADCKLYIGYLDENDNEKYKYIDYAILNKLFNMLGLEFREGKDPVIESATNKTGLDLLFEKIGVGKNVSDMVGQIAGNLIDAYQAETADNETISVIDINFGNLLSTLADYGSVLNATVKSFVQETPWKDLDLTTMHGIIGHLTIVTVADADGLLTGFELAINVPDCTFYICEDESKLHYDIPAFSVALYAKDFSLDADKVIEDVIPAKAVEEAVYFSPTNFNIEGDVTVDDTETEFLATFRYHLVTEINPFKPSEAKVSFTIKQTDAEEFDPQNCTTFLKITYDQKTNIFATGGTAYEIDVDGDGKITAVDGEKAYTATFTKNIMREILTWLGIWDDKDEYNGFSYNGNEGGYFYVVKTESYNGWEHLLPSAKALLDNELGRYLLECHKNIKKSSVAKSGNANAAESDLTGGNTEGNGSEDASITDLIGGYFNKVSDLINKIKDGNVEIKDGGFTFHVTAEELNDYIGDISEIIDQDFIAFLNDNIPGAKIPDVITDPSVIDLQVNTTDHKKQLYLTFTYNDDVYEITFDAFVENQFSVYFKLVKADRHVSEGDTKIFTFDLVIDAEEGTITALYKKDGLKVTEVTHKNFSIDWGGRNTNNLEMYGDSALVGEAAGKIFDPTGSADCIGTKLVGGLMEFLNMDVVYPVSKFLVRQLVKLF